MNPFATKFSNAEYADIILYYGKGNCNAVTAQRLYAEAFPNSRVSCRNVFQGTYDRIREAVSVLRCRGDRTRGFRAENAVLDTVVEDPTTSMRKVSRIKEIPRSTVNAVLK